VRIDLSPRWGFVAFPLYPRLTPWAAFLRRFAATESYTRADAAHNRSAILAAIFSAAFTLTPLARRSMFTMTSPLRIMKPEPPGAT